MVNTSYKTINCAFIYGSTCKTFQFSSTNYRIFQYHFHPGYYDIHISPKYRRVVVKINLRWPSALDFITYRHSSTHANSFPRCILDNDLILRVHELNNICINVVVIHLTPSRQISHEVTAVQPRVQYLTQLISRFVKVG